MAIYDYKPVKAGNNTYICLRCGNHRKATDLFLLPQHMISDKSDAIRCATCVKEIGLMLTDQRALKTLADYLAKHR